MRYAALTFSLILIDQLSKTLAVHLGWPIFLNDQFAFSLPLPIALMFVIYFAVLVAIFFYAYRTWHRFQIFQKYAWCFVFAGGLSNIGERVVFGQVRDFIPIANGVLNLADFFILFGLVMLLISQRYSKSQNSENL